MTDRNNPKGNAANPLPDFFQPIDPAPGPRKSVRRSRAKLPDPLLDETECPRIVRRTRTSRSRYRFPAGGGYRVLRKPRMFDESQ